MVLDIISLMSNDFEHLFWCFFVTCISFLESVYSDFCPCFNRNKSCVGYRVSNIFLIQDLLLIHVFKVFFSTLWLVFFLTVCFEEQKFFFEVQFTQFVFFYGLFLFCT